MNMSVTFSRETEKAVEFQEYQLADESRNLALARGEECIHSVAEFSGGQSAFSMQSSMGVDTEESICSPARQRDSSVAVVKDDRLPWLHDGRSNDDHQKQELVWTKPKLLRKKEAELSRCKELLTKKAIDCANAVSGECLALERQAELKRRLCSQKSDFESMKRVEHLRNRERFVSETEKLRRERDEAQMTLSSKEMLVKRLKIRVRHLEQVQKQKDAEIAHMKRDLDAKNTTLKNLLRKLVLVQFSKKKTN